MFSPCLSMESRSTWLGSCPVGRLKSARGLSSRVDNSFQVSAGGWCPDTEDAARWPTEKIGIGDKITVRFLEADTYDAPESREPAERGRKGPRTPGPTPLNDASVNPRSMQAFEILTNGIPRYTAGRGRGGWLAAGVGGWHSPGRQFSVYVWGVEVDTHDTVHWPKERIQIGAEVTVRFVEKDTIDPPSKRNRSPPAS